MKKILFFSLCILLTGCGLQYDGDERFLITGRLVDQDNVPLSNSKVELFVYGGYSNDDHDLISFDETDENGVFKMVFPRPINAYEIELICNRDTSIYQDKSFLNIKNTNFTDFKFNLNTIKLFKKEDISKLEITLNQVNSNKVIKQFKLIGNLARTEVYVNPLDQTDPYPYVESFYSEEVMKNQTIIAEYALYDYTTNQTQTLQQSIIVGSNNVTQFSINY
ncbi:DUF4198 domain-containing protein [Flavobacterium sp. SM15]|uniref:DUF4198 domain-containing protein n=1 Tax=Flavobacterium sp. SM15 TaxID=2908005 RepID=UPI001EDA442D|nr:DUF4198 domain-containing protein [Flavobacterium sp. SM15]MCG2612047.1 DUF4198 domain-containing protein [Flavobacterium sp. SM15]